MTATDGDGIREAHQCAKYRFGSLLRSVARKVHRKNTPHFRHIPHS